MCVLFAVGGVAGMFQEFLLELFQFFFFQNVIQDVDAVLFPSCWFSVFTFHILGKTFK